MKCDECGDEFIYHGDTICDECIDMMDDEDYYYDSDLDDDDDYDSDLDDDDYDDDDDGDELLERQELSDFAQDDSYYSLYDGDGEYYIE